VSYEFMVRFVLAFWRSSEAACASGGFQADAEDFVTIWAARYAD
jgi:hypothetical protein